MKAFADRITLHRTLETMEAANAGPLPVEAKVIKK